MPSLFLNNSQYIVKNDKSDDNSDRSDDEDLKSEIPFYKKKKEFHSEVGPPYCQRLETMGIFTGWVTAAMYKTGNFLYFENIIRF